MSRLQTTCHAVLLLAFVSSGLLAPAAFAVGAGQAAYTGGTLSLPQDTPGSFDTVPSASLVFRYTAAGNAPGVVEIGYESISFFEYKTEVAHHIGVLPAIAVSLVKRRERKHLFTISFVDSSNASQVSVFEVSKHDAQAFLQILRARAPHACGIPQVRVCGIARVQVPRSKLGAMQ